MASNRISRGNLFLFTAFFVIENFFQPSYRYSIIPIQYLIQILARKQFVPFELRLRFKIHGKLFSIRKRNPFVSSRVDQSSRDAWQINSVVAISSPCVRHVVKSSIFPAGNKSRGAPQTSLSLSHVSPTLDRRQESVKRHINHESFFALLYPSQLFSPLPCCTSSRRLHVSSIETRDNDPCTPSNFEKFETLKNRARFERGYNLFIEVLFEVGEV